MSGGIITSLELSQLPEKQAWRLGSTINIVYFGRAGGSLLLQQIRIIYKIGSVVVNISLSLSLFIYSINKKLKIENIKNKKYVQEKNNKNMYKLKYLRAGH